MSIRSIRPSTEPTNYRSKARPTRRSSSRRPRTRILPPTAGPSHLSLKGPPARPIVIKAAGDGEAIFDGAGAHTLFDVMGSEYNIFDGLTIRNTDIAFFAGQKEVAGAKGQI